MKGTLTASQGAKPKVQADLFYDQPQVTSKSEKNREESTTKMMTPMGVVSQKIARDVRFSSPLENIPSCTASKQYLSRSSLKTRVNEDRVHPQPMIQVAVQTAYVAQPLEIVVHPVRLFRNTTTRKRN